ncbi:efflux RND transporter periplasmic adaptor subunit [Pseudazoarcus pumilus]|uniref:Efflux transporter periplasmic adaptor subunit n=1 Tax=Pseudazoarcus pumilus TaxID=2067960 RepID=A0A2I6S4E4_9RHOO|nr:efflux RND transporter periplasmic adaptor subunit [Pseudazoarcus pumilus]AUN94134.1 efflux transporter periplasmic adaptor subunit [Pseudazoarcus pumilus]
MKKLPLQGRTLALLAVIVPLLGLFIYVGLKSGPLAPVAVTVETVQARPITPRLFGIGITDVRYTYKIGPTFAGRVEHLAVHVGDKVEAGQTLGEMDPVDLDDQVRSRESAVKRAQAQLHEAQVRRDYAQSQTRRYEDLFALRASSEELLSAKKQELRVAEAALSSAREELARARADHEGLVAQRNNLRLVAPSNGIVAARDADPGTTVVAGQTVVEIIDPASLWINVRFDQMSAAGLTAGLPAWIQLRSREGETLKGRVLRVEPKADAVTEEILAKVVFDSLPRPLPPLGELAEVTIELPAQAATATIPNAALRREDNRIGVWRVVDADLAFTPITAGTSDLDGYLQVREGLDVGDQIVVYSEKALTSRSSIHIVDRIPGSAK